MNYFLFDFLPLFHLDWFLNFNFCELFNVRYLAKSSEVRKMLDKDVNHLVGHNYIV